jgi:hypothetical protein
MERVAGTVATLETRFGARNKTLEMPFISFEKKNLNGKRHFREEKTMIQFSKPCLPSTIKEKFFQWLV